MPELGVPGKRHPALRRDLGRHLIASRRETSPIRCRTGRTGDSTRESRLTPGSIGPFTPLGDLDVVANYDGTAGFDSSFDNDRGEITENNGFHGRGPSSRSTTASRTRHRTSWGSATRATPGARGADEDFTFEEKPLHSETGYLLWDEEHRAGLSDHRHAERCDRARRRTRRHRRLDRAAVRHRTHRGRSARGRDPGEPAPEPVDPDRSLHVNADDQGRWQVLLLRRRG